MVCATSMRRMARYSNSRNNIVMKINWKILCNANECSLLIFTKFFKMYIEKEHDFAQFGALDHLVLWIYLYVACQQGSAPLLSEEPNSGTP